ncbi:MAG: anti-sigma factor domain-containing protein [Desulfitobacterium sp.]|nr:anti-sigma factor domain-containing protein [Desulfitobacterium sp.]
MNEQRAVVLEKERKTLTVLTVEGEFRRIKYKGEAEVGEEISLPTKKQVPVWYFRAGIAAVLLIAITAVFTWTYQPATAVAMLSLDINPSLQLTLDQRGKVFEIQTLNQDAQNLITDLSLEGEYWKDAMDLIIRQSIELDYLNSEHAWVVVGFSSLEEETPKEIKEPKEKKETKKTISEETINKEVIAQNIEETALDQGLTPKVAVYELSPEEIDLAQEKELSLGEYALINTAEKVGVKVEPEKVKKGKERYRLLEMPEIQEQLRKDKGLGKLGQTLMEQLQNEDNILQDLSKELKNRPLLEPKGINNSRGKSPHWNLKDLSKWQGNWNKENAWELKGYYEKRNKLDKDKKSRKKYKFPGGNGYKPYNFKPELEKYKEKNKNSKEKQNKGNWHNKKEWNKDKYRDYLTREYRISS